MPDNVTPSNELVMRYQFESYMKCSDDAFHLIGEGFTAFPLALNPKEYTRKYIHDKTERSDVIGYAPSVSYSCDMIKGDPCVQEIVKITNNELVGNDTHREIVNVDCWDEVEIYTATADTALDSDKTYYTKDGSTYTAVAEPDVFDIGLYYEKSIEYTATKRVYSVIPGNKADGTDALIYTGTLKAESDLVKGTFNRTTKTFTPAV